MAVPRSKLVPDKVYYDSAKELYAVTPDCIGIYWYDTKEEVEEQHGPVGTVHVVEEIAD